MSFFRVNCPNLNQCVSLRVGSYRVIFQKKEKELVILVIRIGHRKKIYLKESP
jgi:mRNA-degrading endonuclease RelE of RelBE toxin-antitoxin system